MVLATEYVQILSFKVTKGCISTRKLSTSNLQQDYTKPKMAMMATTARIMISYDIYLCQYSVGWIIELHNNIRSKWKSYQKLGRSSPKEVFGKRKHNSMQSKQMHHKPKSFRIRWTSTENWYLKDRIENDSW